MELDFVLVAGLGMLTSIFSAAYSFYRVLRRETAEKRFAAHLAKETGLWGLVEGGIGPSVAESKLMRSRIEELLWRLDKTDRSLIIEGLRQSSAEGRSRYLMKLVGEARREHGAEVKLRSSA